MSGHHTTKQAHHIKCKQCKRFLKSCSFLMQESTSVTLDAAWIHIVRFTSAVFAFMHAIICHTVLIKCRFMFLSVLQCHTVYIVTTAHMHLFMHLFNKRTALKYDQNLSSAVVNEASRHWKRATRYPGSRWDPYYWPPWNIHLSSTRPSSNEIWRVSHENRSRTCSYCTLYTIIKVKLKYDIMWMLVFIISHTI